MNDENAFIGWINKHLNDDTTKLRLKYASKNDGIDYTYAILQIDCRRKYAKKLSATLAKTEQFYFPDSLSGEQSTSDMLADFHASLVGGGCVADLTAGLGIDCMHIAPRVRHVVALERQDALADALRHNAAALGIDNIEVVCCDCREYIKTAGEKSFSYIFIDPARRDKDGRRVYALAQCDPDVTAMLPAMKHAADKIIIKMSPMLDISAVLSELPGTARIISLGTTTECKELIAITEDKTDITAPEIESVTIKSDGTQSRFSFTAAEENETPAPAYSIPSAGDYVYEPYPSLMKAGAPKLICKRYGLSKPAPNTMVFHSPAANDHFPGTRYKVMEVITYESKHIKRLKKQYPLINVAVRNFDISADTLRAKLGVKDGGQLRLLGISDKVHRKYMLILSPA